MSSGPGHRRRQGASRRASAAPDAAANGLRWYLAGVLSGVFGCLAVYLLLLPPDPPGEAGGAVAARPGPDPAPQPQFEFYDLLPRQTVEVPREDTDSPAADEAPAAERREYLLQAGSFRQESDADQRRAELILLGLEPRIERAQGEAGVWHRVYLGPFESRSAMARARSLAAQQNIDTLVLRRSAG